MTSKGSNITLQENYIGNAIYRACLKNGKDSEEARSEAYRGIDAHREAPHLTPKQVVDKVIKHANH